MLSQAIASLCTAALFLAWEMQTSFFKFARIVELIDEISNKRIHNEEKIRENFLSTLLWEINAP